MKRLNHCLQNSKPFEIRWTVTEKSRPEHGPKLTHLWDQQPTGSHLWRHFQSNIEIIVGYVAVNVEVASSSCCRYIFLKNISRLQQRSWTSTIALSENAYALCLIRNEVNKLQLLLLQNVSIPWFSHDMQLSNISHLITNHMYTTEQSDSNCL